MPIKLYYFSRYDNPHRLREREASRETPYFWVFGKYDWRDRLIEGRESKDAEQPPWRYYKDPQAAVMAFRNWAIERKASLENELAKVEADLTLAHQLWDGTKEGE